MESWFLIVQFLSNERDNSSEHTECQMLASKYQTSLKELWTPERNG